MYSPLEKYSRRYGLALMLSLIVVLILGSTFWERSYVGVMKDSCASMYDDRLMPAAALFHLSDQIHSRRLVLEEHLGGYGQLDVNQVHHELGRLEAGIAAAIAQIDGTRLIDAESQLLDELKGQLAAYGRLEARLLAELAAGREATYDEEIRAAFDLLRTELIGLTKIQEQVGKDLSRESFTVAASASSLTHFQLAAGFILGLFASVLAIGPRLSRIESKLSSKLH